MYQSKVLQNINILYSNINLHLVIAVVMVNNNFLQYFITIIIESTGTQTQNTNNVIFVLYVGIFSIIKPYSEHSSISNCYLLKFRFEWKSDRFIATKAGHDSHLEFGTAGYNFILFYLLFSLFNYVSRVFLKLQYVFSIMSQRSIGRVTPIIMTLSFSQDVIIFLYINAFIRFI